MCAYGQETILRRIEMRLILEERRLGERTLHRVAPSVELAREDGHLTRFDHGILLALLLASYDGECAMPADVVERVDVAVAVFDQEEVVTGHLEADVFASLGETLMTDVRDSESAEMVVTYVGMAYEEPFLAENRSPFQLVDRIRAIPGGRQVLVTIWRSLQTSVVYELRGSPHRY